MNTISRAQFLRGNWRGHKPELRPPWALQEDLFVEACDGCGACVAGCPVNAIKIHELSPFTSSNQEASRRTQ